MKYPVINKQPMRSVNIPELSGGVNLRDSVTLINDNQLTDCKNMWFSQTLLRTRPGLKSAGELLYDGYVPSDFGQNISDIKTENAVKVINGNEHRLLSVHEQFFKRTAEGEPWSNVLSHIQFYWAGDESTVPLPTINSEDGSVFSNYFIVQNNKTLYCFAELPDGGEIYKLEENGDSWVKLTDEDMYIPVVVTNCRAGGYITVREDDIFKSGGVLFEGYNLLGSYYKIVGSTYCGDGSDSDEGHLMTYAVLSSTPDDNEIVGKKVKVEITNIYGKKYVHQVTVTNNGWAKEAVSPGDGLYMFYSNRDIQFKKTTDEAGEQATITKSDYVRNNMVITAPCANSAENLKKVFSMTRQMWFGGDAAGISGGTRLFLGANTNEKEKNLVIWSGLNNPLYFSENCYSYVGNGAQRVTAFGKQSDMLVIFKERETYLTQYVKNSNITASDLINQNVVDYTASTVYFPMIQLHSGIGCDCPDSVQLCRNRLVWACSDGNVYTLCNENQFSERTIFKVSDMISRKLKSESNLINALSADIDSRYYLFVGSSVYVMEYESYGYTYVASYSKAEDAQLRIPWWYWKIPVCAEAVIQSGQTLTLAAPKKNTGYTHDYGLFKFDREKTDDCGTAIQSLLRTKIFDFGAPAYSKNVPLVNIAFGNNGGFPVSVSFVTDTGGRGTEEVTVYEGDSDAYTAEYVHNRQLRPCTNLINRIGLRIECEGVMSIAAVSLNYRLLGGIGR